MAANKSARRVNLEDLHVDPEARPGWVSGADRVPGVGEEILCAGGPAAVLRVLGRTGDGSRLLEVQLEANDRPTFAAASNVRVAPGTTGRKAAAA
jgi:hypothetical protein